MAEPHGQLRLLPAPEDRGRESVVETELVDEPAPGRKLAPSAPPSPGTVPLELARELRPGEALVWWNHKHKISWRPVAWVLLAGLTLLAFATLFAPELWRQPVAELGKWTIPVLAPAGLLLAREWLSRRALLVTDSAIVELDHRGRSDRLAFRSVRRVRRDLLTGGVLLEGARHKVRVPPQLAEDARAAIASQTRLSLGSGAEGPEDPLGWMPR